MREVAAPAQLRDLELDHPGARVPLPAAIAVALGHPALRVALAAGGADQLRDLRLHQLSGDQPHRLAQHVGVLVCHHLSDDLLDRHALALGHRGALLSSNGGMSDDHGRRGGRNLLPGPESRATETLGHPRRGPHNGLQGLVSFQIPAIPSTASYTTLWDVTRVRAARGSNVAIRSDFCGRLTRRPGRDGLAIKSGREDRTARERSREGRALPREREETRK